MADHAVTGHDDTERVAPDRAAGCAYGQRPADALAQFAVSAGLPALQCQQGLPNCALKVCAGAQVQGQVKDLQRTAEIGLYLAGGLAQNRVCRRAGPGCVAGTAERRRAVLLVFKPGAGQTVRAGGQREFAQGGGADADHHRAVQWHIGGGLGEGWQSGRMGGIQACCE